MRSEEVKEIFERLRDGNSNPLPELDFTSAYTLLVAVVLSAQATDRSVNLATKDLFKVADTPEKMVALGQERLIPYIKPIGLYQNKSKHVIELSKALVEKFNSVVPDNLEELVTLPGVGRKTANVVLNVWFKKPTMPVDTHVFRVANRLGLSDGKTPLEVEKDLLKIVPEEFGLHAHHWLLLHGRYVCTSRNPKCSECILCDKCSSLTR
ncbi:endonuclease III [Treponema sp.]|uniref:endonuclease III n=1 Tax=Treponema sp. TaxID=166 RepID=UPI00298DFBFD|nr:endonuclease III [Treponema sp.]MCQ2241012.1 endonuclease III [Treponema sp.]